MLKSVVALLLFTAVSTHAASTAVLELNCQYPEAGTGGPGTASASFTSGERNESLSVVYVLSAAGLQKELTARSSVRYSKITDDHYVSAGRVFTVRNIEKHSIELRLSS